MLANFKEKLAGMISPKMLEQLKWIKHSRKEFIFNLLDRIEAPEHAKEVSYLLKGKNRWQILREWTQSKLDDSLPRNVLNAGCGDGIITEKFFIPTIGEKAICPKAFFSLFSYYTLEYFDLDLNQIQQKQSNTVYYSDIQDFKTVNVERLKTYPLNFHKGHIKASLTDTHLRDNYPHYKEFFDIIYIFDVFEHLDNPFMGAKNLDFLLKTGGSIFIITPFSYPYHKDPEDYFRFTHKGIEALFTAQFPDRYLVEESGYDITDRRDNRGGFSVPADNYGGWRENWMVYGILQKIKGGENQSLN